MLPCTRMMQACTTVNVCMLLPACRLLKEPDAAGDAAAAAADEEAADDDDEEDFGGSVLVAERTVDRQILDAILQAGVH